MLVAQLLGYFFKRDYHFLSIHCVPAVFLRGPRFLQNCILLWDTSANFIFCHAPKSSKLWPHQQKEFPIHVHASSEQFQQHQTSIPVVVYQKEPRAYYVATLPPGTDHCVLAQASQPSAKRVASTAPFCLDERACTHGPILRRTWQHDSNSYYMYDFSVCLGKFGICAAILLLKLLHHWVSRRPSFFKDTRMHRTLVASASTEPCSLNLASSQKCLPAAASKVRRAAMTEDTAL